MVERMAGIYSADYHMGITHLVANEVGTKKYQVSHTQTCEILIFIVFDKEDSETQRN